MVSLFQDVPMVPGVLTSYQVLFLFGLKQASVSWESRRYRSHDWYGIIAFEQINGMRFFMESLREFFERWNSLNFSLPGAVDSPIFGGICRHSILALSCLTSVVYFSALSYASPVYHIMEAAKDSHSNSSRQAFLPFPLIHLTWLFFSPSHLESLCNSLINVFSVLDIHSLIHSFIQICIE